MATIDDLRHMKGQTAVDLNGAKLGTVGQIYVDDQTSQPVWVTISTGLLGTKESFAPLYGSRSDGEELQLAVPKDLVKDAPGMEANGHIKESENDALYQHYDGYLGGPSRQDQQDAGGTRDDPAGRPGLRKYDATGNVTPDGA